MTFLVLERLAGQGVRLTLPDGREMWVRIGSANACPVTTRKRCPVKLLFNAPADVSIVREELLEQHSLPT